MIDLSQLNSVLLSLLTLLSGTGVVLLYNFSSELVKVKVDIGGLKAQVDSLNEGVRSLVSLTMENAHV